MVDSYSSKSLFIVSTPAQAFFLSLAPQLIEDNSILILTVKKKKEEQNILKYLQTLKWKKIYIWYIPRSNSIFEYIKIFFIRINLFLLKINSPDIEKIYLGSYSNIYHLSVAGEFERNSKKFLLYDGLQMITVADIRNKGDLKSVKYPLLHRFFRFKMPKLASINYVSPIAMNEITANDSFYLIKNSLTIGNKNYDDNICYFIGSNLPGIGIVSKEFYIKTLLKLKGRYSNKEIIYVPHPREDKTILPIISEIFLVLKLNNILEEHFILSKDFPGRIFSFYSSVLINLIFLGTKSKIIAINIPVSEIKMENNIKSVTSVYEYFNRISEDNFSVIDLKVTEEND